MPSAGVSGDHCRALAWTVDHDLRCAGVGGPFVNGSTDSDPDATLFEWFDTRDPNHGAIGMARSALAGQSCSGVIEWNGCAWDVSYRPVLGPDGTIAGALALAVPADPPGAPDETRYRRLYENAPLAAFAIGAHGRVIEASGRAGRMVGAEPVGREFVRLFADESAGRPRVEDALQRLRDGESVENCEALVRAADGTTYWVSLSGVPVFDADGHVSELRLVALAIDDRKRTERELRESEERARTLLDGLPDAVCVHVDGVVRYANPRAADLFGAPSSAALEGLAVVELICPEYVPIVRERMRRLLAGAPRQGLLRLRLKRTDGDVFEGETADIRVSYGKETAIAVVVRDLSDRQELEEQLRRSQRLGAVGELAGGLAHDFNNLLTVIHGYASLLAERPSSAFVAEITKAAQRAAELTRRLLALGRREEHTPEVFAPAEVLERAEPVLRSVVEDDIELLVDIHDEQARVLLDRGEFEQVVLNLVSNARDAMPRGGRLTVSTGVREHDGVRRFVLAVADTGQGMDEATRARVLEPFFTTKPDGTGLGLATVQAIVTRAGGDITVQSEPRRGTIIAAFFPLAGEDAEVADPVAEPSLDELRGTGTILLVDDEPMVRDLVTEILRGAGYAVLAAHSAKEALELAAAREGPFRAAIIDVVLPDESGAELARQLRERRPDLAVLFMSGYGASQVRAKGVGEDAAFLKKPYRAAELLAAVRGVSRIGMADSL